MAIMAYNESWLNFHFEEFVGLVARIKGLQNVAEFIYNGKPMTSKKLTHL